MGRSDKRGGQVAGRALQRGGVVGPLLTGLVLILTICAAGFVFQDKIALFFMRPSAPFETTSPPPAPDYERANAWAAWPDGPEPGAADVFYIHGTTYWSRDRWNAPFDEAEAARLVDVVAAPNEAGPFTPLGRLFAPRYRQATLFSFFTHKYDGVSARRLALADVSAAFERFLTASPEPDRPIVLVGYGQGASLALGLLRLRIDKDDVLRRRVAAVYAIGAPTPAAALARLTTPACADAGAVRCVVGYVPLEARFDAEIRRAQRRAMTWTDDGGLVAAGAAPPPLCVNPLTWTTDETYAPPDGHLGAASATGLLLGETPPAIERHVGAACAEGVLIVDRPSLPYLRRPRFFGAKWKPQDANLFYFDLRADAARRVAAVQPLLDEETRNLAPIGEAVELAPSPVNKVPD
ncbi:MAG: DUF3089 domain-containing protein [Pseudomonadota bacterium]